MLHSIWTAATGMQAQQMRINTIANNLSNVNTTGYKKSSVDFQDLLYQTISAPTRDAAGVQYGLGVKPVAITKFYAQGNLQITNNPLNVAIDGVGFFQVRMADGSYAYTRDGSFKLSPDGYLTTSDGLLLEPQVRIPAAANDITIGDNGMVYVKVGNNADQNQIGQINLTRFANPAGLEAIGQNLVIETGASGQPSTGVPGVEGMGVLRQRALETSNVELVTEMVMMIATQKAYDTSSKAIQVSDKMMDTANQLIR
ncbi:MAG TPA: flagellar basal-body rod protein FlgG [Chroococcales cyanobacterium]|jgi:flagellar basal-body rod protein FlgG